VFLPNKTRESGKPKTRNRSSKVEEFLKKSTHETNSRFRRLKASVE
jgi:hypothetical protein